MAFRSESFSKTSVQFLFSGKFERNPRHWYPSFNDSILQRIPALYNAEGRGNVLVEKSASLAAEGAPDHPFLRI
jgi:hypothetical protein